MSKIANDGNGNPDWHRMYPYGTHMMSKSQRIKTRIDQRLRYLSAGAFVYFYFLLRSAAVSWLWTFSHCTSAPRCIR